jgi:hypothetical protein
MPKTGTTEPKAETVDFVKAGLLGTGDTRDRHPNSHRCVCAPAPAFFKHTHTHKKQKLKPVPLSLCPKAFGSLPTHLPPLCSGLSPDAS